MKKLPIYIVMCVAFLITNLTAKSLLIDGVKVNIDYVLYENPMYVDPSRGDDNVEVPDWMLAYYAYAEPHRFTFQEWISHFSDTFIRENGINEEIYDVVIASDPTYVRNPNRRAVSEATIQLGSEKVFKIVAIASEDFDKFPERLQDLGWFTIQYFKKTSDGWVNEKDESLGFFKSLPITDIQMMESIMESTNVTISEEGVFELVEESIK